MTTYALTGATGKLGNFALDHLLSKVDAGKIVALARDPAKLADYAAKGLQVRAADFDEPDTLLAALEGVDRLLLISGSALGERPRQHGNVITAARQNNVSYIAYTSILDADNTPIKLGAEHKATEELLAASNIAHDLCRNGWYNENYVNSLAAEIEHGTIIGAQGDGKISSASRADLGEAAATILLNGKGGEIYDLAGDNGWTMADFAAEVGKQAGKKVNYVNMGEADYADALAQLGLPEVIAKVIANSAYSTSLGALQNTTNTLSKLIGRPTTPIAETIAQALRS